MDYSCIKIDGKVRLILQLLHPYTFIPTSTVIREMRYSPVNSAKLSCKSKFTLMNWIISKSNHYILKNIFVSGSKTEGQN